MQYFPFIVLLYFNSVSCYSSQKGVLKSSGSFLKQLPIIPKQQDRSLKERFHPRNPFKKKYDLDLMCLNTPELKEYVIPGKRGGGQPNLSIDFKKPLAAKVLNQALLFHEFGIEEWNLPEGKIYPQVPKSCEYIQHIADLLSESFLTPYKTIPTGGKVVGLDVGTGASIIYPLLGASCFQWKFIATEVDPVSYQSASNIISNQKYNEELQHKIDVRFQNHLHKAFEGILKDNEVIDFVMCNPSYYPSVEEYHIAQEKKKGAVVKKIRRTSKQFRNRNYPKVLDDGEEGKDSSSEQNSKSSDEPSDLMNRLYRVEEGNSHRFGTAKSSSLIVPFDSLSSKQQRLKLLEFDKDILNQDTSLWGKNQHSTAALKKVGPLKQHFMTPHGLIKDKSRTSKSTHLLDLSQPIDSELWYPGGEAGFVQMLINESYAYKDRCLWFSAHITKHQHIKHLEKLLAKTPKVKKTRVVLLSNKPIKTSQMDAGKQGSLQKKMKKKKLKNKPYKKSSLLFWTFQGEMQRRYWGKLRGWSSDLHDKDQPFDENLGRSKGNTTTVSVNGVVDDANVNRDYSDTRESNSIFKADKQKHMNKVDAFDDSSDYDNYDYESYDVDRDYDSYEEYYSDVGEEYNYDSDVESEE